MFTSHSRCIAAALTVFLAMAPVLAAPAEKPVAGQQVRFRNGSWSGVPQVGQKPRSARFELANTVGAASHSTCSAGKRTKAMNGPPEAFWHMRQ